MKTFPASFTALVVVVLALCIASPVVAETAGTLSDAQITAMGLIVLKEKPPAPDFTLVDKNGKNVTLSSLRGKVVLLNFWATWCPPCRAEMPSMEKLYQSLRSRTDFVMLAVDSQEPLSTVTPFLEKYGYSFPILLDTTGEVGSMYSVTGIPTSYLIDAQGRVLAGKVGAHDWSIPAIATGLNVLLASK